MEESSSSGQTITPTPQNLALFTLKGGKVWDVAASFSVENVNGNSWIQFGISQASQNITGAAGKDWLRANCSGANAVCGGSIPRVRITLPQDAPIYFVLKSDSCNTGANASAYLSAVEVLEPRSTITCHGDSLTQGVGVTPWPTTLASLLGRTVENKALSGRLSKHIAGNMGAAALLLSVTGDTIPASGAVIATFNPAAANLFSNSNMGTISYTGSLYGIRGTLAVSYTGPDTGTATFTRTAAGCPEIIPPDTPFIIDTAGHEFNTTVIWAGKNDQITNPTTAVADILANVARMVAFLKPVDKRFIVMGIHAARYEPIGSGYQTVINAINQALRIAYPNNFLDIGRILVNAYDPSVAQDVTDHGNLVIPSTLVVDGMLHPNTLANTTVIAPAVQAFISQRGW